MLYRIFNRSYTTKAIALTAIVLLLTACGGGSSGSGSTTVAPSSFTFGGSVGDGPVVGAAITVQDNNGNIISTQTSDSSANYQITLSAPPGFPLTITASGGTDLVTGSAPGFSMKSVVQADTQGTANINPFSTLIVTTAQNMPGGLTASNLDAARTAVMANLGFGIDTQAIPDAIATKLDRQNVANLVKACEALAEMIRRTRRTLLVAGIDQGEDTIISRISGDLTDGEMDGVGAGADSRIAAAAHIVSAQILLESMINKLEVGGIDATAGLDNAIATTLPSSSASTGDVTINSAMIAQAKAAIAAAQAVTPSAALSAISTSIDNLVAGSTPDVIESQLPATSSGNLDQALLDIATATESMLDTVNTAVQNSTPTPPSAQTLILTFSTDTGSVAYNGSTVLNWSSSNATSCSASSAWSGSKGTSGINSVGPLTANVSYTLTCTGTGGQVQRSVSISVGAPPVQIPTISLSANPSSVNTNSATTLSWSTNNVTRCTASGGWSGAKATSGSASSGALTSNTSFTLTCSGTGGTASQSVTVTVSAPPPPPAPGITLSANPTLVGYNSSTTLSWTVSNATSCTASGGWSGSKNASGGSQSSAALTIGTTFTLSCSGTGGNASKSVTVAVQSVTGSATLSWTPPTANEDGSVLTDLAGYKIHYGASSRSYTNTIVLSNPGLSTYVIDNLTAGTYYFVVTAFNTPGNESAYSNEGSKTIN